MNFDDDLKNGTERKFFERFNKTTKSALDIESWKIVSIEFIRLLASDCIDEDDSYLLDTQKIKIDSSIDKIVNVFKTVYYRFISEISSNIELFHSLNSLFISFTDTKIRIKSFIEFY